MNALTFPPAACREEHLASQSSHVFGPRLVQKHLADLSLSSHRRPETTVTPLRAGPQVVGAASSRGQRKRLFPRASPGVGGTCPSQVPSARGGL